MVIIPIPPPKEWMEAYLRMTRSKLFAWLAVFPVVTSGIWMSLIAVYMYLKGHFTVGEAITLSILPIFMTIHFCCYAYREHKKLPPKKKTMSGIIEA